MTVIDQAASAPASSTVSEKKLAANRRNAAKSTGPRTDDGKRRSSLNAISHGLFCRDAVLPGEDDAEFLAFRDAMLDDLRPRGIAQRMLADRVVLTAWRLRRVTAAEADAHDIVATLPPPAPKATLKMPALRPRGGFGAYQSLCKVKQISAAFAAVQLQRDTRQCDPAEVPASLTLARSLCDPSGGPFDRLSRYEQRLESMLHRDLRALQQLRKLHADQEDRDDSPDTAPALQAATEVADAYPATMQNEAIVQNEPTAPPSDPSLATMQNEPTAFQAAAEVADLGAQNEPTPPPPRVSLDVDQNVGSP